MTRKTLLTKGTVVDGTGAPPYQADVLIVGELIVEIGRCEKPRECDVIDCTDLIIAPGFIDSHNHLDLQVHEDRPERIHQGITGEVVGNCGFSPYPATQYAADLRAFASGLFCSQGEWGWSSAGEYISSISNSKTEASVASLVGHGSLRIATAGNRLGPLTNQQVASMCDLLDDFLKAGAVGLSTGLMYVPGSSAPFDELEQLCRVVAKNGKTYATHIRSYSDKLVEAIDEQLELARRTGCRLQISHFQAAGAANWHLQQIALEKLERAHDEGLDVAFDCYPYIAGSTVMTMLMPAWSLDGGVESMVARLLDPAQRRRISSEIVATLPWRWHDIYIAGVESEKNKKAIQRNLLELSDSAEVDPVNVMLDLLIEEKGMVNVLLFNQSESNLKQTLCHPLSIIVSDGFYVKGLPHPRLFGTFPKFIGTYCRDHQWITLAEAVSKITDMPAQRFGLKKTGRLQAGFIANVTVFDLNEIDSPATYEQPTLPPRGVKYVLRKGTNCLSQTNQLER